MIKSILLHIDKILMLPSYQAYDHIFRYLSFKKFALGEPYIKNIILRFYQSENALLSALKRGETESSSGISPEKLSSLEGNKYTILHAKAPQSNRVGEELGPIGQMWQLGYYPDPLPPQCRQSL